jgi:MFS family permease
LIADLFAPAQRGRATMVIAIGQLAGVAAAFAVGGELLALSGSRPGGWHWAMFWLSTPLILATFPTIAMREPQRAGASGKNPSVKPWRELWRYRRVIAPVLAGIVMAEVTNAAVMVWAAPSFSRHFALAPNRLGAIMALGLLVSGTVGPIAGGTLADLCQRIGGSRLTMSVLAALALVSAPAGLFALLPGVASESSLLIMFITIVTAICVMGTTLFTVVIPNDLRGLCIAVLTAASTLIFAVAPLTVSLLSSVIGGDAMIGTALAIAGVTMMLLSAAAFAAGIGVFPCKVPQ